MRVVIIALIVAFSLGVVIISYSTVSAIFSITWLWDIPYGYYDAGMYSPVSHHVYSYNLKTGNTDTVVYTSTPVLAGQGELIYENR